MSVCECVSVCVLVVVVCTKQKRGRWEPTYSRRTAGKWLRQVECSSEAGVTVCSEWRQRIAVSPISVVVFCC